MCMIVLTPEELHDISDLTLTERQQYYMWCGILALRGEPLPLTYYNCPKHVKGHMFKVHK